MSFLLDCRSCLVAACSRPALRGVPRKLKEPVFRERDYRPDPQWESCPLANCSNNNWCRYPEECAAKKEGSE